MSYQGDGERSAIAIPRGAAEALQIRSTTARFVAPGTLTAGRYGLYEWNMAPRGPGATPHFHRTFSESFYVVSGEVQLFDGHGWTARQPGDFLFVPEGGIHGFRNEADAAATILIVFAPAPPREAYFKELAAVFDSGRTLSRAEWVELWARHDQFPADE